MRCSQNEVYYSSNRSIWFKSNEIRPQYPQNRNKFKCKPETETIFRKPHYKYQLLALGTKTSPKYICEELNPLYQSRANAPKSSILCRVCLLYSSFHFPASIRPGNCIILIKWGYHSKERMHARMERYYNGVNEGHILLITTNIMGQGYKKCHFPGKLSDVLN